MTPDLDAKLREMADHVCIRLNIGASCLDPSCSACLKERAIVLEFALKVAAIAIASRVAEPPPWQPIATAPAGIVWYWVRPKTAEEAYRDTSGHPIVSASAPRVHAAGTYGTWSAAETATHWMYPIRPDPPKEADLTALRAGIAELVDTWRRTIAVEREAATSSATRERELYETSADTWELCADALAALAEPREEP